MRLRQKHVQHVLTNVVAVALVVKMTVLVLASGVAVKRLTPAIFCLAGVI